MNQFVHAEDFDKWVVECLDEPLDNYQALCPTVPEYLRLLLARHAVDSDEQARNAGRELLHTVASAAFALAQHPQWADDDSSEPACVLYHPPTDGLAFLFKRDTGLTFLVSPAGFITPAAHRPPDDWHSSDAPSSRYTFIGLPRNRLHPDSAFLNTEGLPEISAFDYQLIDRH